MIRLFACVFAGVVFFSLYADETSRDSESAASEQSYEVRVSEKKTDTEPLPDIVSETVISEKDIEKRQSSTVLDAIQVVPGLYASEQAGPGSAAILSIRGGKPGYVLILLDGIELNNPVSIDNSYNLADLTSDNIAKIEVIKGPQAVLYGPNAMNGVIRITTRQGVRPPSMSIKAETGTLSFSPDRILPNTISGSVQSYGGIDRFDYSVAASYYYTQGISGVENDPENDPYRNFSLSARTGVQATDDIKLNAYARYIDSDLSMDAGPGLGNDERQHNYFTRQIFSRLESDMAFFDRKWAQNIGVNFSFQNAEDRSSENREAGQEGFRDIYMGEITSVSWTHVIAIPGMVLRAGTEFDFNRANQEQITDESASRSGWKNLFQESIYLQDTLIFLNNSLLFGAGLRFDASQYPDKQYDKVTWSASGSYHIEKTDTLFKAHYGTVHRPPSLYQLYGPYQNKDLIPEDSWTVEGGVEQRFWSKKAMIELTGFYTEIMNMIQYSYVNNAYEQYYLFTAGGLEASFGIKPVKNLSVTMNYTFTLPRTYKLVTPETVTYKDQVPTLRRPEHMANIVLNYLLFMKLNLNLSISVVGARNDELYTVDHQKETVRLAPYVLGGFAVSYTPVEGITISGRIENMFDAHYQAVAGYATPRISAYCGIKMGF